MVTGDSAAGVCCRAILSLPGRGPQPMCALLCMGGASEGLWVTVISCLCSSHLPKLGGGGSRNVYGKENVGAAMTRETNDCWGVVPAQCGVRDRRRPGRRAAHRLGWVRLPGVYGWAAGRTGIPEIICETLQYARLLLWEEVHDFHRLSEKAETASKSECCLRGWNYAPCTFFSFRPNARSRNWMELVQCRISGSAPGNGGGRGGCMRCNCM